MKAQTRTFALLTLLALVFTIGLTFASVELPRLLDSLVVKNVNTPDVATGLDAMSEYKTDLYLRHFNLRAVGLVCLAIIVVMIVAGFVTEKSGWTSAGALLLFLPVFGHFATTMFFLGGLGFLRLLWLPVLDVSFRLFRLGEVINWPYRVLLGPYSSAGLGEWLHLSTLITGLGLLIFFLGTLGWFAARARKRPFADFWVYRFSRHPQYLGWIVWSYGIMFLPGSRNKLCYELSNSLPWLLSTMIIIGVAMLEELKMSRVHGEAYNAYRKRVPFLIPLPRFVGRVFSLPQRLFFKKPYPGRKREIAALLGFYTILSLAISLFYGGLVRFPAAETEKPAPRTDELVSILKNADNRAEKRRAADLLAGMGEPSVEPLVSLLNDKDGIVRAYAAGALGATKSGKAVSPLSALLFDEDPYVRRTAAEALGRTGSTQAIPALVEALKDATRGISRYAATALGQIGHPDAVPPLIDALRDPGLNAMAQAAAALASLDAQEAVGPLVRCFEEIPDCPYDAVGAALSKLGSERAADAWILGLEKSSWWHPRTVCAAAIAKNRLEKGLPALRNALKDESPEVRRAAILALMEFGSEKSVPALREALADPDLEVRIYAGEALKKIGALS